MLSEPGSEEYTRAIWLQQVLDRFTQEIRDNKDLSNWRSTVLNPVLVRAMHRADDLVEKSIVQKAKAHCGIARKQMTAKDWEAFYLNLDVLHPIHQEWWHDAKSIPLEDQASIGITENLESGEVLGRSR